MQLKCNSDAIDQELEKLVISKTNILNYQQLDEKICSRCNLDVIRCNKLRFRGTDKDQKLHEQVCS